MLLLRLGLVIKTRYKETPRRFSRKKAIVVFVFTGFGRARGNDDVARSDCCTAILDASWFATDLCPLLP